MAKALRSDLVRSVRWSKFVEAARNRGDAAYPVKCPSCEVEYTTFLVVMEDAEAAVNLLREHLPKECPDHQDEIYIINEDPYRNRTVAQEPD